MPSSKARSMIVKAVPSSTWLPKIMVPSASRLTRRPLWPRLTVSMRFLYSIRSGPGRRAMIASSGRRVLVEAAAGLASQLAPPDLLDQDRGGPGATLLPGPILPDAVEDVEAAEVEELEGPHGPVEALLDRHVDVLRRSVAALQQVERLLQGREQDPVDDEAMDLLGDQDRDPADAAYELHRGLDGLLAGLWAPDHLAQLQHRDRVEEVQVAAALRTRDQVSQT